MASVGARLVKGHRLRVTRSASALIARAVLDAQADAELVRTEESPAVADVIVLAVPPGKGAGALNVALRAVELDLQGDGEALEARLYAAAPGDRRPA